MSDVVLVYRSRGQGCGIHLFNKRLGTALTRFGFDVRQCNLFQQSFKSGAKTIIHYVPSMWAEDEGALERVLEQAKRGHVIAILHGIYEPGVEAHLKESRCPELASHVYALGYRAETIIALSQSCKEVWHQWDKGDFVARLKVIPHPAASKFMLNTVTKEPYLFLGGISRPKKDIMGERVGNLLLAYLRDGLKVWVHISNWSEDKPCLPAWRLTTGTLSDKEWFTALARATAVLCPYETKIQCVSGVMTEAISLGTRVMSTDFLFAREMKRKYPELVYIEDDLLKWDVLPAGEKLQEARSYFPSWEEFAVEIARELLHLSKDW